MNCAIDIGNTRIKVGLFDGENMSSLHHFSEESELFAFLETQKTASIIVSSVRKNTNANAYTPFANHVLFVNHKLPLPITVAYDTPESLGNDRLSAAVAGNALFPDQDVLVIDCGTCITFDFVNAMNTYEGGSISLGLEMRFKALNTFTSRLPLLNKTENIALIGKDTKSSIESGVIKGTITEISGLIDEYNRISNNLAVVLCGGDAKYISSFLETQIITKEHLVLEGLNRILIYNVDKK